MENRNLSVSQLADLKQAFDFIDKNGDASIEWSELFEAVQVRI
jgi:Ca2+-binding EF-hand superfamily protein